MHADVLLGGTSFRVEFAFALVVQTVAAAHHLLGDILATQRTHALGRHAIR